MTDFADEASERTEAQIEQALASRKPDGPRATGYCLECGEKLSPNQCDGCRSGWPLSIETEWGREDRTHRVVGGYPGELQSCTADRYPQRWCDAQCRDDWERRQG